MIAIADLIALYQFLQKSTLSGHVSITLSEGEAAALLSTLSFVTPAASPTAGSTGTFMGLPFTIVS